MFDQCLQSDPEQYDNSGWSELKQRFDNWFETQPFPDELRNSCLGSFDQAYELARKNNRDFDQLDPESQFRALIEETFCIWAGHSDQADTVFPPVLGKTAAAHTVEKKGDKFFVIEDEGEKAAGPFDSQEEAYARANKLNDLENLEKEAFITPAMKIARKMIARTKIAEEGYQKTPSKAKANADFIFRLNQQYKQICESMGIVKPAGVGILPDGRIVQPNPVLGRSGVRAAPGILIDSSYDPGIRPRLIDQGIDPANLGLQPITDEELQTFKMSPANEQYAKALPISLKQLNYMSKAASQGDKPSPNAAQAVFNALAGNNKNEAKELLKQTDCPEGCETHPEGKCNHGYMSAGRTRVRYLVSNEPFGKEDTYTESVE